MIHLFAAVGPAAPANRLCAAGLWSACWTILSAGVLAERVGFTLLPPDQTGLRFTNSLSIERYTTNQIYLNGSGVAAGDVDNDGFCDLYFASISGRNALFRNLGNWRFEDVTERSGTGCAGLSSSGVALADLDGDGDLDLVVNTVGNGTLIFSNKGTGQFVRTATLNPGKGGTSLAIADVDGDGALDLYVCNYRTTTLRDMPQTNFRITRVNGQPVVAAVNGEPATLPKYEGRFALNASGNISEFGEADVLYRNDGRGGFTPISLNSGTFLDEDARPLSRPLYDWTLAAMFRDLNGDSLPDLYVCNDFATPDAVWLNQGGGRFRALPRPALRNISKFSMGVDVADVNRDGLDDLFVLDMLSLNRVTRLTRADKFVDPTAVGEIDNRPQVPRNTLHLNRGDGTYAEIASLAGLDASEWSWTPVFLDVDLDGYEDLLVTTGHARDDMDIDNGLRIERTRRTQKMTPAAELGLRKASPGLASPKLAFRNSGNLRFEETGARWGFCDVGVAHGMCLADLDNDADLDIVVNNLNTSAGVYRNEATAPRIAVRLKGAKNSRGIGARITLSGGAIPIQTQEIICGGRYLSSDDPIRAFAAGTLTNRLRLEVRWPGGRRSALTDIQPNRVYEVAEPLE